MTNEPAILEILKTFYSFDQPMLFFGLDFDRRREPSLLRLANLKSLNADTLSQKSSTLPEKSAPEAKTGSTPRSRKAKDDRKPALAVILDLLAAAEEPVPSSEIDAAVIKAG